METDINSLASHSKSQEDVTKKLVRDKIFNQSWKRFQKFKEERDFIDKISWNKKVKEHQVMDNSRYISILKTQIINRRNSRGNSMTSSTDSKGLAKAMFNSTIIKELKMPEIGPKTPVDNLSEDDENCFHDV